MKLTWFGGTTIRIHIGGAMLVADADARRPGVDPDELVSGADQVFVLAAASTLPRIDGAAWQPRRPGRLIDEEAEGVRVQALGDGVVLIDAVGEPPLVLVSKAR